MDELTVGRRPSLRSTLTMAAFTGLVLPGFGLLIIPLLVFVDFQLGGLLWVLVWTLSAILPWFFQREHRLVGETLVTTYRNRVVERALRDVRSIGPMSFFLPAARVVFDQGDAVWVFGSHADSMTRAVIKGAPIADNLLPSGNWLRPRRIIWFAAFVLLELAD